MLFAALPQKKGETVPWARIRQLCSGGSIKWSAHAKREFSAGKLGKQRNALRHKMREFSARTQLTARAIYV